MGLKVLVGSLFSKPPVAASGLHHLNNQNMAFTVGRGQTFRAFSRNNPNDRSLLFEICRTNDGRFFLSERARMTALPEGQITRITRGDLTIILRAGKTSQNEAEIDVQVAPGGVYCDVNCRALSPQTAQLIETSFPPLTVKGLSRVPPTIAQIDQAIASRCFDPGTGVVRAANNLDEPGDFLQLDATKRKTVLIGDLHANLGNLQIILERYRVQLERREVNLVFLGDVIHTEEGDTLAELLETKSSLQIMDVLINLQCLYPECVHILRGNHDEAASGRENLFCKGTGRKNADGSPEVALQGRAFRNYVQEVSNGLVVDVPSREAGYDRALQRFFDAAPLSARINGGEIALFVAHTPILRRNTYNGIVAKTLAAMRAGRGGLGILPVLINARIIDNGYLASAATIINSLTWSRAGVPGESINPNRITDKNFDNSDLQATRELLGLQPGDLVVGGHTHNSDHDAAYLPDGLEGMIILMASHNQALSVLEVDSYGAAVVDLAGQSPIGGRIFRQQTA
ncbi:metallophosphoesterase [Candidatus Saganbacteria bacterium]|nr:metallophosphoesterase [Candidatus Saganbacteria bacterium]